MFQGNNYKPFRVISNLIFHLFSILFFAGLLLLNNSGIQAQSCTKIAPYLDNLDGAGWVSGMDTCWMRDPDGSGFSWLLDDGGTGSASTGPSGDHTTGSGNYLYTEATNGSAGDTAWIQTLPIDLSALLIPELKFFYHRYGAEMGDFYLQIHDGSTWQTVDSLKGEQQTAETDPYSQYLISLAAFAGDTVQIGFMMIKGSSFHGDMAIDDIEVREMPSCYEPTSLTASNITDTSADLDWVEVASATEWQIEYGMQGFVHGSGIIISGINAKPYNVTGLSPTTNYDFYVRSVCAPGDTSIWSGPIGFTTFLQSPQGITCTTGNPTILFSEEFDIQGGWTGDIGTSNGQWQLNSGGTGSSGTGPSGAYSGTNYIYFEASSAGPAAMVSPAIDLTAANDEAELSFWLHAYGGDIGYLNIGVSNSPTGPFANVFSYMGGQIQTANSDPWVSAGVNLDAYVGQVIYLEFEADRDGGLQGDIALDLLELNTCVTCLSPNALLDTNLTPTSVDLSWTQPSGASQWEISYGIPGFTPGNGTQIITTNNPFSLGSLSPSTSYDWYVRAICGPGDTSIWAGLANFRTPCVPGQITSTTSASRCGIGTVTLQATADTQSIINWYDEPSGGALLDTGTSFTTPVISSTTDYYVAASRAGAGTSQTGAPFSTGANGTYTLEAGLFFDALESFTIQTIYIYPVGSGAGSVDIALLDPSGSVIQSHTFNGTGTASPGIKTPVNVNFNVPAPGNQYALVMLSRSGGISGLIRDLSSGIQGGGYPFTVPGIVSITSGRCCPSNTSTSYYYFYDWTISSGCEGPRQAVTATVNPAPVVNASTNLDNICSGSSTMLTANSGNTGYTYTWEPSAQTGGTVSVSPTANTLYTLTAEDNSGGQFDGCVAMDTIAIEVVPDTLSLIADPPAHCITGNSVITIAPSFTAAPNMIQWQESMNGSIWTDIAGADSMSYNTPILTDTMYYRAVVRNGDSTICNQPQVMIPVNNPQILATMGDTACPGPVSIMATATSGANINWYSQPSGGSPLATGDTFTTTLATTTDFYAAATTGGGSTSAGRATPFSTSTGFSGNNYGLVFDAFNEFALLSVDVYPTSTSSGSLTIELTDDQGTVLKTSGPHTIPAGTGTTVGGGATPFTINLNFVVPPGTGYHLRSASQSGSIIRDNPIGTTFSYPLPIGSVGSITSGLLAGGSNTNTYYYFYNWMVSTGCESVRVPVTATILTPPSANITPDTGVCPNEPINLVLDANNDPGTTVAWSTGATGSITTITATGVYWADVTDMNGCTTRDSVTIEAYTVPAIDIGEDSSVCEGDLILFGLNASWPNATYLWQDGSTSSFFNVTQPGLYWVEVTSAEGCVVRDSVMVTEDPLPNVDLGNDTLIAHGTSLTLDAGNVGATFAWNTGATTQTIVVDTTGTYMVTVTDANGCSNADTIVVTVSTGVESIADIGTLSIFPNPTGGDATLEVRLEKPGSLGIGVTDVTGKSVYAKTVEAGTGVQHYTLPLSDLATGLYLVKLTWNDAPLTTLRIQRVR